MRRGGKEKLTLSTDDLRVLEEVGKLWELGKIWSLKDPVLWSVCDKIGTPHLLVA